ncbi:MAG: sigma-70 family RNA polymerase sigma factor, partial [Nitrospiraceae bacterium]
MRKEELIEDGQEQPVALDLESDDQEANDILEVIERESSAASEPEPQPEQAGRAEKEETSFALESLYFRSFGERGLLNRDEEIALAKQIDQGTRAIRGAIREAVGIASHLRKIDTVREALIELSEIRGLSGFSATALDRAEERIAVLVKAEKHAGRSIHRVKQLHQSGRRVRESRRILETAKDELVRCNLRLVVDIAKHYNGRGLGLLDLVQEGNIGLMKAAERYQYRKGFKFSTYATWWIRQGITRALADQSRTIRIPVHMTESSHRIMRTARRLAQQHGSEPRAEDIGKILHLRADKIQETMQVFQEPMSLENPIGDGETLFGELIADKNNVPPDSHVHRTELT